MAAKRKAKSRWDGLYFVDFSVAGISCHSRSSSLTKAIAETFAEQLRAIGAQSVVVVEVARGRVG